MLLQQLRSRGVVPEVDHVNAAADSDEEEDEQAPQQQTRQHGAGIGGEAGNPSADTPLDRAALITEHAVYILEGELLGVTAFEHVCCAVSLNSVRARAAATGFCHVVRGRLLRVCGRGSQHTCEQHHSTSQVELLCLLPVCLQCDAVLFARCRKDPGAAILLGVFELLLHSGDSAALLFAAFDLEVNAWLKGALEQRQDGKGVRANSNMGYAVVTLAGACVCLCV